MRRLLPVTLRMRDSTNLPYFAMLNINTIASSRQKKKADGEPRKKKLVCLKCYFECNLSMHVSSNEHLCVSQAYSSSNSCVF